MQHTIKDLENGKKELILTVDRADLEPHIQKAYNEVRKDLTLPGFRRGKVPNHIIKNMHGKQLEFEAAQEAGNEYYATFLNESGTKVAGTPELHDIKFNNDKTVSYILNIELFPEIELKDYQSLTIDEPTYTVSEEDVDKQVAILCREHGTFEATETVEDAECVIAYRQKTIDPANEKAEDLDLANDEAATDETTDLSNSQTPKSLTEAVMDKKVGDKLQYTIETPQEDVNDLVFAIEITSIDKSIPAEFDDHFANDHSNEKFETAEDFRYDLQLKMQEGWDKQSRDMVENNIVEKMIEMHGNFDIPDSEIERQAYNMVAQMFMQMTQKEPQEGDIKPEFVEPYKPMAKRTLQWEILRDAVAKKEDIEVDEYDVEDYFEEELAKMGDHDIDDEQKEEMLKNAKDNAQLKMSILNKKVIDLIYDYSTTNEVDFEDQHKKAQEESVEETEVNDEE